MKYRVGVDIGGTFTDSISISSSGQVTTSKALTTPGELSQGVIDAVTGLNLPISEIEHFVHGTTAGLNAFLERRGARTALITTKGFRDVYEIGRANRPDMYNLKYKAPKPLIPRKDIFELTERMSFDGQIVLEPETTDLERVAESIIGKFDVVAVVLLHAYKNPQHENAVVQFLAKKDPKLLVVASHTIAPEWREYERTSTTAMSAYIAPIINEYLSNLGDRLQRVGLIPEIRVMQSNGGVMSATTAKSKAIQTLFSGPVGGTIAGVHIGKTLGINRLICVDMGGTSFDVSLVVDHKAEVEPQTELQGLPILSPTVSMNTIGAGGGSIAYLSAGALRVGPRSAGAIPGPACYGRGGTEPTVTDANLALGRLPQIARLGGSLPLDVGAARLALDSVGSKLNLDTEETASGIIAIVNAAMANAIREITVSRGIDPRDFALVAFGGAGPLHAIAIAEELELGSVIIPSNPGVLSAYGMLQADTRHDLVTNYFANLDQLDGRHFSDTLDGLRIKATEILDAESVDPEERSLELSVDLRYTGQEYTVRVEWPSNWKTEEAIKKLPSMFEAEHLSRYGHNNPGERIEIVNLRVTAIGKNSVTEQLSPALASSIQASSESPLYFNGTWFDGIIVNRSTLATGDVVLGPAVILEPDCTSLIHPGWKATVTKSGHLMVERRIDGN